MHSRRDTLLEHPALIPIAGHCDRKPRFLDREVTTIGRARGSDLCLEANEISTLHCIIYRSADGFRIRDCNSRWGTRINGHAVKTGTLHDGDIVNLGPFAFEFRLPPRLFTPGGERVDPIQVEKLKRSRRRLAERALGLRKRLQSGSPGEQDWVHKAHVLKEKIRVYDQRLRELEGAEEELADERRQLADEIERHKQHVQKMEHQVAKRLADADDEIHQRWQDFQRRCQAEATSAQAPDRLINAGIPGAEQVRDLQQEYTRRLEQLQREQQEFLTMKQQWADEQSKTAALFEEQQQTLAKKKAELVRMMNDLKKMQDDLRRKANPDVRALQEDVERLESENAELRAHIDDLSAQASPVTDDIGRQLDELRAEIDLLHEEVEIKDKLLCDKSHQGDESALKAENELLKKLLEEKDRDNEALANSKPKSNDDLERYEAELNEYRRQLEDDREKLNKEVTTLRERNKELDEAIREMEMEMSKERAELARERMRLERIREEVKADSERLQREQSVRDSMAPVQKLRDELNGKQPPAKPSKPLNDRLRGMRDQLSDSHPSGS